tara:strand:- start:1386 stop:1496 length:111 start_codon:yes stop_codon:yes gene_type:complete
VLPLEALLIIFSSAVVAVVDLLRQVMVEEAAEAVVP